LLPKMVQNGRIVAHANNGREVLQLNIFGEMFNQSKFTQGINFGSFHAAKIAKSN
jgi:hypothetical protein